MTATAAETTTPVRRNRARLLMIALAIILAVVLVIRLRDQGGLHAKDAGPVYTIGTTLNSFPVPIGKPFTFGQANVKNRTGKTAVFEAVRTRPALPDGMEIVAVSAALRVGIPGIGTSLEWPDPVPPCSPAPSPWCAATPPTVGSKRWPALRLP